MPTRAPKSKRVQVRLSEQLGSQVELLAQHLGVSESSLCAILVATGLARFGDVGVDLSSSVPPAGIEALREVRDAREADASDPRHEPPGFRPGGRPRALIDEGPLYTHGEMWTGYMKGL